MTNLGGARNLSGPSKPSEPLRRSTAYVRRAGQIGPRLIWQDLQPRRRCLAAVQLRGTYIGVFAGNDSLMAFQASNFFDKPGDTSV